jgi:hypothetical protein
MRLNCVLQWQDIHRPCDVNGKLSGPKFISGHRRSCEEDGWRQFTEYPSVTLALAVAERPDYGNCERNVAEDGV